MKFVSLSRIGGRKSFITTAEFRLKTIFALHVDALMRLGVCLLLITTSENRGDTAREKNRVKYAVRLTLMYDAEAPISMEYYFLFCCIVICCCC